MNETFTGYYVITTNSVTGPDGDVLTWDYDGHTLLLHHGVTLNDYDIDCGDIVYTGVGNFKTSVTGITTAAKITGTLTGNVYAGPCGNGTFSGDYDGNITRR